MTEKTVATKLHKLGWGIQTEVSLMLRLKSWELGRQAVSQEETPGWPAQTYRTYSHNKELDFLFPSPSTFRPLQSQGLSPGPCAG